MLKISVLTVSILALITLGTGGCASVTDVQSVQGNRWMHELEGELLAKRYMSDYDQTFAYIRRQVDDQDIVEAWTANPYDMEGPYKVAQMLYSQYDIEKMDILVNMNLSNK